MTGRPSASILTAWTTWTFRVSMTQLILNILEYTMTSIDWERNVVIMTNVVMLWCCNYWYLWYWTSNKTTNQWRNVTLCRSPANWNLPPLFWGPPAPTAFCRPLKQKWYPKYFFHVDRTLNWTGKYTNKALFPWNQTYNSGKCRPLRCRPPASRVSRGGRYATATNIMRRPHPLSQDTWGPHPSREELLLCWFCALWSGRNLWNGDLCSS